MPANLSFVESQARDAVLAHYGLAKTANAPFPRFEDAVKIVSPLRRAGAGFLAGALPGAAVGGIAGALTADKPEDRMRRALMGAAAGTAVGGGLNAARHYTNQRELISEARKAYDFFGNDAIKAIAEAEGHLKKPDIPRAAHSMYLSQLDNSRRNLESLPTDIEAHFEPKRTYLERLFQKQPE